MTMSHKEALDHAVEFGAGSAKDLDYMLRAYLDARGLVMVPKEPTEEMVEAAGGWDCPAYDDYVAMLAAAPDPFKDGE